MADYAVEIDLLKVNTSHVQVLELVGSDRRVLDVGCWTGDLGRAMIDRGCRVSGVEIDEAAAEAARQDFEQVVVADLDTSSLSAHFEPGSFDVVVFADVLEHLRDPVRVLADAAHVLAEGGRVVISIPNVTHGSLRLALLQGRWTYSEVGLLDHTHIQFFSRARLLEMVRDAGMVVDDLRATLADPLGVEVAVDAEQLPVPVVDWVRHQPDALVYQFQLAVSPAGIDVPTPRAEPVLVPAVAEESVRIDDWWTQLARGQRDELASLRDAVEILMAARSDLEERLAHTEEELARSQERVERRTQQLRRRTRRLRRVKQELADIGAGEKGPSGVTGALRRLRRR